ncbi:hypothetical protein B0H19DRAFT_315120 [Mycena capillaripes]|nr:hypothetical protein B0H19DRAFT_315120 [Mycena capillaripes]
MDHGLSRQITTTVHGWSTESSLMFSAQDLSSLSLSENGAACQLCHRCHRHRHLVSTRLLRGLEHSFSDRRSGLVSWHRILQTYFCLLPSSLHFLSMPTIIHLGEDVLVKVLSSCDVYTVLRVSQVNRYLRIISMTKQIWIFLVQTLQSCSIIALPPGTELATCGTEELVKMVKRTVTGPRTLACTTLLPPTIFHEVVLPAESLITREYHYPIVKLVGGRCVVLVRRESLEVWDIFTQRKIYNHQGRTDWPAAELVRESIILGFIYRNEDNFETVEIRQIDLRSMEDVLQAKITIRGYTSGGWYISGDFAAITLRSSVVLFVNWREQTAVLLCDVPLGKWMMSALCRGTLSFSQRLTIRSRRRRHTSRCIQWPTSPSSGRRSLSWISHSTSPL